MRQGGRKTALVGALLSLVVSGSALAEMCYDRSVQGHRLVVDSHLHFQPFSGPHIDRSFT